MATQAQTKGFNWLGFLIALPATACVGFLAHIAFTLEREALCALFTAVGAAVAYGGTKIR